MFLLITDIVHVTMSLLAVVDSAPLTRPMRLGPQPEKRGDARAT
jgi:hypothetical protein